LRNFKYLDNVSLKITREIAIYTSGVFTLSAKSSKW